MGKASRILIKEFTCKEKGVFTFPSLLHTFSFMFFQGKIR